MDNAKIQELLKKQGFKCGECGAILEGSIFPLEDKVVCGQCLEKNCSNSNAMLQCSENGSKYEKTPKTRLNKEKKAETKDCKIATLTENVSSDTYPFKEMTQWASELTAEMSEEIAEFYWTPKMKTLLQQLDTLKRQFIAVIGLQGCGKTAFRRALYHRLYKTNNIKSFKWFDPEKMSIEEIEDIFYAPNELSSSLEIASEGIRRPPRSFPSESDTTFEEYREMLGVRKYSRIVRDSVIGNYAFQSVILIDFPDYDKKSRSQRNRDLDAFQRFWDKILNHEDYDGGNIVVFWQKELWSGHCIQKKFRLFELKPFTPEQFLEFFKMRFSSIMPFNEESVLKIAVLSRGIWRRFKRYVLICLENFSQKTCKVAILPENIDQWINVDVQLEDMELELGDVFTDRGKQRRAVEILRFLQENGETDQPTLAEKFFGNEESSCSRFLQKLEDYKFIKRSLKGHRKTVTINGVEIACLSEAVMPVMWKSTLWESE